MFSYHLEKIFSYLSYKKPVDYQKWGIHCAKQFSELLAKKWVDIDTETMSYDEIKLLTITACYLELQAEREKINEQN